MRKVRKVLQKNRKKCSKFRDISFFCYNGGGMENRVEQDNRNLIAFWDKTLALTQEDRQAGQGAGADGWKEEAPSSKLFDAAASLGKKKKVLDYGCGSGWAGIIAEKSGCPCVVAVDVAQGGVESAKFHAELYKVAGSMQIDLVRPDWLSTVPAGTFDGLVCSNVLDVVPTETAMYIIREFSRIVTDDADLVIGLNFHLSREKAADRGIVLEDGNRLYSDGVLRLVSRSDEEWESLFAPYFAVRSLEYFAWPGEKTETRRLFRLSKKG